MKHSFVGAIKASCGSRISLVRAIAIVLFVSATVVLSSSKAAQNKNAKVSPPTEVEHLPPDEPSESEDFYLLKRVRTGEKQLPAELYSKARKDARSLRRYSTSLGAYLSEKDSKSAAELDGVGNWMQLGPGNVGGRTRALVIAPSNPNLIYAAGVAGGVWKSIDGGASWAAVGDILPNLAISSLAIDPSNPNIVYAGTGEGYFNSDAQRGAGIFKTIDGGATWGQIVTPNDDPGFYYVQKLVISPNNSQRIYAGTGTGVWRSNDGGMHWSASVLTSLLHGCLDLAIRTDRSTDYLLASLGTFDHTIVMFNTDAAGGGIWIAGGFPDGFGLGRTSIAIAPSNQDTVYALASEYYNALVDPQGPGPFQYGLHAVFKSTDGGSTWVARVRNTSFIKLNTLLLSNPIIDSLVECGQGSSNALLNQGWYDNVIAVDPLDPNRVWAGGIDLFRSDDGGANWGLASYWWANPTDPHYVHADQHVIVFHPQYNGAGNKTMFVANDGGVFRTDNARSNVATGTTAACDPANTATTWTTLNNGYDVTQFYYGVPYPDNTAYLGGTQDNGTIRGSDVEGNNAWRNILGGDGGAVAIDRSNTQVLYVENTGLSIKKSTNGGGTFTNATNGITESPGNFLFISPFTMDPSNSQRLWTGGRHLWRTANGAASWSQATNAPYTGAPYSSIAVSPSDPNYVAGGSSDGYVIATKIGLTVDASQGFVWSQRIIRNGYVSCVAYDPAHRDILYATYSTFKVIPTDNHVYRSTDAGLSWRGIDGVEPARLPDIPVHSIVVDPSATSHLYVGTDLGVFVSLDWGQTWARENSGFIDVNTESLAVNAYSGGASLYGFTHGRGAWRVPIPPACGSISPTQRSFTPNGGTGSISVSAQSGCNWTAVTNDNWITITLGSAGTGTGIVSYTVSDNTTGPQPISRTGAIFVAEQVFLIQQDGNNCSVTVVPPSQYLDSGSGTATATGNASGGCSLTAVSNDSWISITSPPMGGPSGFLEVDYSFTANLTGAMRTGSISVSGPYSTTNLFVRQAASGCSYSVTTQGTTADGSITTTGSLSVTATATCSWTAVTGDSWVSIDSGASGTGNGTVNYTLMRNNTPDFRLGHIVVAGHDVTLQQTPGSCVDFSVSPTAFSFNQYGGLGIINVATASFCQWGASSDSNWVNITSPAQTVGSGPVTFTVAPNPGGTRTATIALPFHTATVTQAGGCLITFSPLNSFFPSAGGNGSVTVSAMIGCAWNATSNSDWLTILSGASGTGSGVITYTVGPNPGGAERVGILDLEGAQFFVTQSGCEFSISPNGVSVSANDTSTRNINIAAPGGCSWTSQTSDSWITIVTGQNGSGNGNVGYTVAANTSAPRIGTITAAGQTFTVNQSGIIAIGLGFQKTNIDGDAGTDIGFYRGGLWGFLKSSQAYSSGSPQFFSWGASGLQPIVADFDGDGKADIGYMVPPGGSQSATYSILLSTRSYSFAAGQPLFVSAGFPSLGDTPVVGDFDGDGKADPGIWRASQGVWIIPTSASNYTSFVFNQWGQLGDIPVVADFDGDGKADIGFYRDGVWGVLQSSHGYSTGSPLFFSWGGAGLQPIVGDFDGDGKTDIGYMVPPSAGQSATYAILLSSRGYSFAAGQPLFVTAGFPSLGDTPTVGDFDGDGKADPGIWRESQGVWIIPLSSSNYSTYIFSQWGQSGDIAFPNTTGKH